MTLVSFLGNVVWCEVSRLLRRRMYLMLLSDKHILQELKRGNIIIEPFDERQLGPNSYDCRMGEWYYQGDANVEEMHLDNPNEILHYWGESRQARDGQI